MQYILYISKASAPSYPQPNPNPETLQQKQHRQRHSDTNANSIDLTRAVDKLSDDVFAQGATGLTDAAVNDLGEVRI